MAAPQRPTDPLVALRAYRQLAPWNMRDLSNLAGAILETAGIRPLNAAASVTPSERTIRFYVTRRLVTPPEGRGTSAVYSYRHLLEVLAIKLRQMEGATLDRIAGELAQATGDVIERRVAAALGAGLVAPPQLALPVQETPPSGRAGRAFHPQLAGTGPHPADTDRAPGPSDRWQRLAISGNAELHLRDDHPLVGSGVTSEQVRQAVRLALGRLAARHERSVGSEDSPHDLGTL